MRPLLTLMAILWWCIVPPQASAGQGFQRLEGHGGPVKGVAVSPDGTTALTASFDNSVAVWKIGATQPQFLYGHDAAVNAVSFLPEGRAVSAGDDFKTILWDLTSAQPLHQFQGHRGKILHIAIDASGRFAATSSWDGWIGLWDLHQRKRIHWLKGHRGNVNAAAFSKDGTQLYSASSDGTIRQWNVRTGQIDRVLVKHGFGINQLVLNEAQGWIAYGAVDGAVRAIDLDTDAELADLTADRRPVLALALSPDGSQLAVGDGEGYVMIIDANRWSIQRDFHAAARGPIWALAWTADGERLLSGGLDDAAVLWPVAASQDEISGVLTRQDRSFLRNPEDMSNGERQFARKCSICHTLTPDGAHRAGPSLWGVFGRKIGTVSGYTYSDALPQMDIIWSAQTINRLFDEGPDHYTPGSKMPMQRITKAQDRQDLILFLSQNTGPHQTGD